MSAPLRQKSLAERVADQIEARIREDRGWKKTLPGYRTLAEHFGTSRKTCMAAMEILELRHVVQPASQGRRRQVAADFGSSPCLAVPTEEPSRRGALLILASSTTPVVDEDWYAIRRHGDCWMQGGNGVNLAQVDYGRYRNPTSLLRTLIETHQAGALLLNLAPKPWILAASEMLPVYLMGGEVGDARCSGDSFSLRREVTRMLAELRTLGHERVLLPVESDFPSFRAHMLAAIQETSQKTLHPGLIEELCPTFAESVPAVWQDYWEKAFSRTSPTAVILTKDAHLLSLYGYCSAKRIEIPRDLSVVYLCYSEKLEWCHPAPHQMRYPLKRAFANFREWIQGGLRPTGMKVFDLEKVPGASVARARRTTAFNHA